MVLHIRVVSNTFTVTVYTATLTSLLKKKKIIIAHNDDTFLKEDFLGPIIHTIKVFLCNANYPLMRFTPFYLSAGGVIATVGPHSFQYCVLLNFTLVRSGEKNLLF